MNLKIMIIKGSHIKILQSWSNLLAHNNQGEDFHARINKLIVEYKAKMQMIDESKKDLLIHYVNKRLISCY